MSSILSRILDANPILTELPNPNEVTVPEPNDRTCVRRLVLTTGNDKHRPNAVSDIGDQCGEPATHCVLRTCCDGPVAYVCDDHADLFGLTGTTVCRNCHHRCIEGVCCHRVITTL